MRSSLSSLFALTAALVSGTGCFFVEKGGHEGVQPGDPLNAQFTLTWVTNDANTGFEVDCRSVPADTVRISSKNLDTDDTVTDLFNCGDKAGRTLSLTAGGYEVDAELLDCGGSDSSCRNPRVLSSAPTVGTVEVWKDGDYDLGHFIFLVR